MQIILRFWFLFFHGNNPAQVNALHHFHIGCRLLECLNPLARYPRLPNIQLPKVFEIGQVLQRLVGNLRAIQIQVLQFGQAGKVRDTPIIDIGSFQMKAREPSQTL